MKAAVVDRVGGVPEYRQWPDPEPHDGEVVVTVEAVAVENVDRAIVAGTHYASADFQAALPAVPCFDGIGRLQDGTLVGFGGSRRRTGRWPNAWSFLPPTRRRSPPASNHLSRPRCPRRSAA
ncbi:hypothetical protein [Planctomonas sp. JC2975]|uniref:hypothetical protein n=1 Tax=Planctomonas sp. JC2975 TaxID=2729626 RepID=UPI00197CA078|nr:hypothetical protein [Planctomonas sp. JC2975]